MKPTVCLMGRSSAGDSPTSYIIQGFVDFLISSHEVATELREHIKFVVIPMMNPDGVFVGNTKTNIIGQFLNRQWKNPCKYRHPSIFMVRSGNTV